MHPAAAFFVVGVRIRFLQVVVLRLGVCKREEREIYIRLRALCPPRGHTQGYIGERGQIACRMGSSARRIARAPPFPATERVMAGRSTWILSPDRVSHKGLTLGARKTRKLLDGCAQYPRYTHSASSGSSPELGGSGLGFRVCGLRAWGLGLKV